ncbi:MAG: hypothetical protein RLZZ59_43 [Pseudomonadota bacterium]|jgi:chromosome segregation ATPase
MSKESPQKRKADEAEAPHAKRPMPTINHELIEKAKGVIDTTITQAQRQITGAKDQIKLLNDMLSSNPIAKTALQNALEQTQLHLEICEKKYSKLSQQKHTLEISKPIIEEINDKISQIQKIITTLTKQRLESQNKKTILEKQIEEDKHKIDEAKTLQEFIAAEKKKTDSQIDSSSKTAIDYLEAEKKKIEDTIAQIKSLTYSAKLEILTAEKQSIHGNSPEDRELKTNLDHKIALNTINLKKASKALTPPPQTQLSDDDAPVVSCKSVLEKAKSEISSAKKSICTQLKTHILDDRDITNLTRKSSESLNEVEKINCQIRKLTSEITQLQDAKASLVLEQKGCEEIIISTGILDKIEESDSLSYDISETTTTSEATTPEITTDPIDIPLAGETL